jgi:hypothetical protein
MPRLRVIRHRLGGAFRTTSYTDTLSLDSLGSGQPYTPCGLATSFDMPALKDGPAALKNLPTLATQTLATGGQFNNLLVAGSPRPAASSPAEPGILQAFSIE